MTIKNHNFVMPLVNGDQWSSQDFSSDLSPCDNDLDPLQNRLQEKRYKK